LTPQSDIEPRKGMPDPKLKKKQFHERMPTPDYDPAIDWIAAKDAIHKAQARYDNRKGPMRILLINASSRSEHTCPGEMSKSYRLIEVAQEIFTAKGSGEPLKFWILAACSGYIYCNNITQIL